MAKLDDFEKKTMDLITSNLAMRLSYPTCSYWLICHCYPRTMMRCITGGYDEMYHWRFMTLADAVSVSVGYCDLLEAWDS